MRQIKNKAQGTVEYLVIVSIVVVLSLVVVGVVTGQVSSSASVSKTTSKISSISQSIGLTESLISPTDGNFVLKLLNNSGNTITVSNVKIGDNNTNFSEDLPQGGSKFFKVGTNTNCEQGKIISQDVLITYVTPEGLTKTQKLNDKVMFDCTPYTITQANLANQCPSVGGGSCTLDGNASDSNVLAGYTYFNSSISKRTGTIPTQTLLSTSTHGSTGYYSSFDLNIIDLDLNSDNIKSGVNLFGIIGTYTGGGLPCAATSTGAVTTNGGYTLHTFTSSGTFTVTSGTCTVEILVVAGGGAGGGGGAPGGGGGAGGLVYLSSFPVIETNTVTVGTGGTMGNSGTSSAFGPIAAVGGGAGYSYSPSTAAKSGGSGGGGGYNNGSGASGTSGQGNAGGNGRGASSYIETGGGGGAGAVGGTYTTAQSGAGGVGLQYSQFSSVGGSPAGWFAGGGGGSATDQGAVKGLGGTGGGGAGSTAGASSGVAGTPYTGGGGGGAHGGTGGTGGSGIVIVRYAN